MLLDTPWPASHVCDPRSVFWFQLGEPTQSLSTKIPDRTRRTGAGSGRTCLTEWARRSCVLAGPCSRVWMGMMCPVPACRLSLGNPYRAATSAFELPPRHSITARTRCSMMLNSASPTRHLPPAYTGEGPGRPSVKHQPRPRCQASTGVTHQVFSGRMTNFCTSLKRPASGPRAPGLRRLWPSAASAGRRANPGGRHEERPGRAS
jgi:hypothetical protein